MKTPNKWKYDCGEKRLDHKWGKDKAGFQLFRGRIKGKCPMSITNTPGLAEKILNEGIPYPDYENPEEIYNVYKGILYRAETTDFGISWHGFPEKEEGKRRQPMEVLIPLMKRSIQEGYSMEFKTWMEDHLPTAWKERNLAYRYRQEIAISSKKS